TEIIMNSHLAKEHEVHLPSTLIVSVPHDMEQKIKVEDMEFESVIKQEIDPSLDPLACEEVKPEVEQYNESSEKLLQTPVNVTNCDVHIEDVEESNYNCNVNNIAETEIMMNSHLAKEYEGHLPSYVRVSIPDDMEQKIKMEDTEFENVIKQETDPIPDPLACGLVKPEMEQYKESLERLLETPVNVTKCDPNIEDVEEVKYNGNINNIILIYNPSRHSRKEDNSGTTNACSVEEDFIPQVIKPFNCPLCNKSFVRKDHLKSHMFTHTDEKPFNCSICDKAFPRKGNLLRHLNTHSKDKALRCDFCNKSFSEKYALTIHLRTHTKEKPFKCSF
ncbi:hypothetical protein L9F63_009148, partial [Diploptera punctata]